MSDQEDALPLRKILIVEDDANYRLIVALRVRAAGYNCLTVSTHSEAIRLLSGNDEIDVVLLDYDMNRSGPDAVVEQINQLQRKLRMIGHSNLNRAREFSALGIDEFFQKPLDFSRFVRLLDNTEVADETLLPPPT